MSSIGKHNIGRTFTNLRASVAGGFSSLYSKKQYQVPLSINDAQSTESLPQATKNPYRKRPVKMVYDPNHFHMFRLPSENSFLLSSWDYSTLFGARRGTNHSPHIRAQMNLDSNLVWCFVGFTLITLVYENKRTFKFTTLRENMLHHDKGWFKEEDFK